MRDSAGDERRLQNDKHLQEAKEKDAIKKLWYANWSDLPPAKQEAAMKIGYRENYARLEERLDAELMEEENVGSDEQANESANDAVDKWQDIIVYLDPVEEAKAGEGVDEAKAAELAEAAQEVEEVLKRASLALLPHDVDLLILLACPPGELTDETILGWWGSFTLSIGRKDATSHTGEGFERTNGI